MGVDILSRNNVVVDGEGSRTLVFAHGFGCDQRVWQRVAPAFAADHRIVLFDYVGAGRSDRAAYDSARYGSLHGYAADLLDVAGALDLRGAVLVAHSVSAMIGVLASIAAPQHFERLVLLAPSPRYLNDPPGYFGGFDRTDIESLLDLMDRNFLGWATTFAGVAASDADLARELAAGFQAVDPRTIREFAEVVFYSDVRADLPKVPVPCLVVQCSDDDIAPVGVGEYTRDHLQMSSYRLLQVSGHMPHMSNAEDVQSVLRDYLATPVA
ncbi:MAG: alpha/beta hydrolase [Vicinamibacterales bacterium]